MPKSAQNIQFTVLLNSVEPIDEQEKKGDVTVSTAEQYEKALDFRESEIHRVVGTLSGRGVRLVVSTEKIGESTADQLRRRGMIALQLVDRIDVDRLCRAAGIVPLASTAPHELMTGRLGMAAFVREVPVGSKTYTVFTMAKPVDAASHKNILLRGPTDGLCRQYSQILRRALQMLHSSLSFSQDLVFPTSPIPLPNPPPLKSRPALCTVAGAGAFELSMHFATDRKAFEAKRRGDLAMSNAWEVLSEAYLFIPSALWPSPSSQSTLSNFAHVLPILRKQHVDLGLSHTGLVSLIHTATPTGIIQVPSSLGDPLVVVADAVLSRVIEPLALKYALAREVLQLTSQVLRIDCVLPAKSPSSKKEVIITPSDPRRRGFLGQPQSHGSSSDSSTDEEDHPYS
mmetsp:Transcript_46168/g.75338  ORF Transcript_46168/g.75338 Transcript_46168/m.75338 type:complete len:399 (-) Transcript_46168:60-1256(-)